MKEPATVSHQEETNDLRLHGALGSELLQKVAALPISLSHAAEFSTLTLVHTLARRASLRRHVRGSVRLQVPWRDGALGFDFSSYMDALDDLIRKAYAINNLCVAAGSP